MASQIPFPLIPRQIELDSPEFREICDWPFVEDYVNRVLHDDIPLRKENWNTEIWIYRDPTGNLVGFGTVEVCNEYLDKTAGRSHPYIPLLAVNPSFERLGHGTRIVKHLIGQAVIFVHRLNCHDILFLDVYEDNDAAIRLYKKQECGFRKLPGKPGSDNRENNRNYIVMTRSLSVAKALR